MSIQRKLVACLLNVSEAKRSDVIQEITKAALSINASSVKACCIRAYELIDLSNHSGGHPRLGAVDLVPFHPISENVTLEECATIARELATDLATSVPGSASFLFGYADRPEKRSLVQRRKQVNWFQGKHGIDYSQLKRDIGPSPGARYGLTGIGSFPYVMNCNVTIDTKDLEFGKQIARAIRGSSNGGLPGVQSMAFSNKGAIEIACNVESIYSETGLAMKDFICSFGKYYHVAPAALARRIAELASERDVITRGTAIVGFTPERAKQLAETALDSNIEDYWKSQTRPLM
ncbi:uncharacterized protein LOC141903634 isoform X2 [Tubulanus polymorphus]|uniref:uncharacterized protein LOC141903634 isoform X2 n=1 Tax=Tubulanus polymorphus TaxID=672921 RepID=UPI003DA31DF3